MNLKHWLKEPLLHFLALGALLFLLYAWRGGDGGSGRIVVTPGQIDTMVAGFTRTWQRPPTGAELDALVEDHVRDEIATREAMAAGLDRDDSIVRRRLRQKLEFLAEDSFDAAPASVADLERWFEAHAQQFEVEPRIALRQVCLTLDRRGAALESDARKLRERLAHEGPTASIEGLGDSRLMPQELEPTTRSAIAQFFGERFAEAVAALEPGTWAGPIPSDYGAHVVLVQSKEAARMPPFAEVRDQVEQEYTADLRRTRIDEMYRNLRERYEVVVERPPLQAPAGPAANGAEPH